MTAALNCIWSDFNVLAGSSFRFFTHILPAHCNISSAAFFPLLPLSSFALQLYPLLVSMGSGLCALPSLVASVCCGLCPSGNSWKTNGCTSLHAEPVLPFSPNPGRSSSSVPCFLRLSSCQALRCAQGVCRAHLKQSHCLCAPGGFQCVLYWAPRFV